MKDYHELFKSYIYIQTALLGKIGVHLANTQALTPVFKNSFIELKLKSKLIRCKSIVNIAIFNIPALNIVN